ncbi:uncharacterized protein L203_103942 [Cryptococcus depauperatus CBS 7841]|uniref:Phospholipase n=1 Tax=Cryptococcus depauperatus CBS 7841 TaxID=1295531 RepID=A0AAJ8JUV5_9TREE
MPMDPASEARRVVPNTSSSLLSQPSAKPEPISRLEQDCNNMSELATSASHESKMEQKHESPLRQREAPVLIETQRSKPPWQPLKMKEHINSVNVDERGSKFEDEEPKQVAEDATLSKWSTLRSRVTPLSIGALNPNLTRASITNSSLPVTSALFAGQLPVMILKTWLDRDEYGRKAVPVLLSNLKIKIDDSIGFLPEEHPSKEMYKIECEYGDGAVKWVVYRELRDFLSLHAHYKAANIGTSVAGLRSTRKVEIPDFPKMSIPYLNKFEKSLGERKSKFDGKLDYAKECRAALQHYLVQLICAVIFRPESNRLCIFLELSALTLYLAPLGGFQGKAGFLRISGSNASRRANRPGIMPSSWRLGKEPKWFIVRDTYCVATTGPETTDVYDVFLFDSDFTIIRPTRYYRQGALILSGHKATKTIKIDSDGVSQNHESLPWIDAEENNDRATRFGNEEGSKLQNMNYEKELQASQHTFYIMNSGRKLKLVAKNARHMYQFIVSMEKIAAQCIWTKHHRFNSFAPARVNVAAQWLVDGRDYFWNLSRAINMAKDRIYIHDWWISPEIYLRRPGDERYRLDNLLKRKAESGVKIFIIIYNEVSDKATPVDSIYTKKSLMNLHKNIMVQRSPSHLQTGTLYWSHVIDETIAFLGGLDLCFGRWDTSQHILVDDENTAPDGPNGPVWRGKDYANERVMEYSNLDKPFEDMIDRSKIPRMPWHDVGLQFVGQPARDLCRHFVQRWNLLIRTKNHKRHMPFLLPPPEFTNRQLQELKLQGSCEVQICRSTGPWSMGTFTKVECSIQEAYCNSIQTSKHFVYIENQFFITSTIVDGIVIENRIGDALVERIIRAHKEKTAWRACIIIPLLPGYSYPIDSNEASSVRLILEFQNKTISRGVNSIFSRLKEKGIEPDDYISFFSLRGWAKFKLGHLTTEQIYIHGKTMIVDDRLILCGSANINERSQRGDRDSEILAVVRDIDMIDSTMAGHPFKVGRLAHSLRVRLMQEHVGVDVDKLDEDPVMSQKPLTDDDDPGEWVSTHGMRRYVEESAKVMQEERSDSGKGAVNNPGIEAQVTSESTLPSSSSFKLDLFNDPLEKEFWNDIWIATAIRNTELFRKVFRCIPDDLVTSWAQYKAFASYADKLSNGSEKATQLTCKESTGIPLATNTQDAMGGRTNSGQNDITLEGEPDKNGFVSNIIKNPLGRSPSHGEESSERLLKAEKSELEAQEGKGLGSPSGYTLEGEKDKLEMLLDEVRGHLVIYPTKFLEGEDIANNFLFNSDKILPLPIYN